MRRELETWHGRDHVTLADERASQQGTQTSTYTGAPVLDPTVQWARALPPPERQALIDREAKMPITTQGQLLGLSRSSVWNQKHKVGRESRLTCAVAATSSPGAATHSRLAQILHKEDRESGWITYYES